MERQQGWKQRCQLRSNGRNQVAEYGGRDKHVSGNGGKWLDSGYVSEGELYIGLDYRLEVGEGVASKKGMSEKNNYYRFWFMQLGDPWCHLPI